MAGTSTPVIQSRLVGGRGSLPARPQHVGFAQLKASRKRGALAAPRPVLTQAAFGARKAAKTAYICMDCGYIYDGREAFEGLDKSYRCPVCNAPKRRFKVYQEPVAKNANSLAIRKARKEQIKGGSTSGSSGSGDNSVFLIGGVAGAVGLAALYVFLNSQY
ncbi:hypothetical protein WJX72_010212 [[Myrmecia] bisecta]|uniref:Rubredoxin-like domain-containing protein n=1 Tax=[Myrmecia] bisecta TaxID=41462 RepID=A0AAW1QG44_9CHLO